jgi:NAD(P)-dependent dehydrogenase (short-subunit alcohol dehydrogenase family)
MPETPVILITGCSSGIGKATALAASARGYRVFATARDPESLHDLEGHSRVRPLALDVTDPRSIREAFASLLEEAGRLDALVNNAGYGQYGAVEDVSAEEWRREFDVNLFGAIEVTRAALPAMRQARGGTIVNVSSVAGKIAIPFAAPYCASKHALEAVSDALRVEVSPFGIRVVVVEPGPIETRFGQRARAGVARFLTSPGPYSDFYRNAERAMDTDFQAGKLPADAVARVILDAIETRRPKTRYPVGKMARALIPLRALLPDRFFDRRMKKALKLADNRQSAVDSRKPGSES